MNKKFIFIYLLILLFLAGCRNRELYDEKPYKVKVDSVEPQIIELDESLPAPFHLKEVKRVETPLGGYATWLKTPKKNQLILLYPYSEKGGHGVLFYDNELNLTKRKIIKKGEGPGEADHLIMTGSEDKLYLIDKIKRRLTIFDHDLSILREKKYKMGPGFVHFFGVALKRDETKILHCYDVQKRAFFRKKKKWDSGYAIRTLDTKDCSINILRSEDVTNDTERQMMFGYGAHWIVHNDFIYFVDLKDYIISKMDFNCDVIKKIKIKHKEKRFAQSIVDDWLDEKSPNKYKNKNMSATFSYPQKLWPATFILKIKNGFAIARRDGYSPKEIEYITADYFTWDMEFKGKIKIPAFENWNFPGYSNGAEATFYYKESYFYTTKQEEEADFIIKWELIDNL